MRLDHHDRTTIVREFRNAHRVYDTEEQDYSTIEGYTEDSIVITPPDSHETIGVSLDVAAKRYRPVRIPGLID
jgi:hypothetical protein